MPQSPPEQEQSFPQQAEFWKHGKSVENARKTIMHKVLNWKNISN